MPIFQLVSSPVAQRGINRLQIEEYQSVPDFQEEGSMHSHNVYFWLKEGLSNSNLLEFEKGLDSLMMTRLVISGSYGKPADTHREVVENTYTYGLSLQFKDTEDHNHYQADPIHLAFVEKHSAKWIRVKVFDVEIKKSR
jgi:hypothetical protein